MMIKTGNPAANTAAKTGVGAQESNKEKTKPRIIHSQRYNQNAIGMDHAAR